MMRATQSSATSKIYKEILLVTIEVGETLILRSLVDAAFAAPAEDRNVFVPISVSFGILKQ